MAETPTLTMTPAPTRPGLPAAFAIWLSGNSLSVLGDVVLYFALGWAASEHGGRWAGVVLSGILIPRIMFTLFGGVLGDRVGAGLVMLVSNGVMIVVAGGFALWAMVFDTPIGLLIGVAGLIGTVDAFYLPSSGSMPRLLLAPDRLPRAMALQQILRQAVAFVGAPLAGLLIAAAGVGAAAGFDAGTFVVMLIVIGLIRPRRRPAAVSATAQPNVLRQAAGGLLFTVRDPVLRTLLLLVASAAGFLIPITSLLIPLLGRAAQWTPAQVGLINGGQAAGVAVLAGFVFSRGALARPGVAAASGLLVAGLALAGLAATGALAGSGLSGEVLTGEGLAGAGLPGGTLARVLGTPQAAIGWECLVGLGTGLFSTHLGPLILGGSSPSHLSRVQSVLLLAQSVPLLVTNNLLGWIVSVLGAASAIGLCAGMTVISAGAALCVPALRTVGAGDLPSIPSGSEKR